jgi:hypothetical protein
VVHNALQRADGRTAIVEQMGPVEQDTGRTRAHSRERRTGPMMFVFVTEAIERIPSGWRTRETYVVHGPDEFEEVFELAEAGKSFELYSRARFRRVK